MVNRDGFEPRRRRLVALATDGTVWTFGSNSSGQLGNGTRTLRAAPEPVTGLGQPATSVAAGGWHSLAALADGTVRAWGSHAEGQGAGATGDDGLIPTDVGGLTGVTRVSAGARHSLAMNGAGQWFGWGSNRDGQLGLVGTVGGATPTTLAVAGLADVVGGIDSASGLLVAQAQRYYGYDAQGSVRYQTDVAGAVVARYDYDAFGTLLSAAGEAPVGSDAYLYHGERYDALTGLYHLRARDYDPALGRFHQIDDFAGFADNPYSLNRYNYAESNPVGKHDPAGRFAVTSIGTAMMALHLKDQYLGQLASAGPRFTFDIDEALNRYLMTDGLVASNAPLKLKERELWVRSSGGGLLGSWVGSSGSSEQTEKIVGQGFGVGSDVFFLHQSGARFRQGWLLRAVEHSWGSLQQSRANLNLGPRLPDDPRSKRITSGNVSLTGARWADAIYADALLQASLRSATDAGSAGVRARFSATLDTRRYTTTSLDLTARAISALGASLGGGPVDWQMPIATGTNRHATAVATNLRSLEQSDGELFADAFAQHVDKLISAEVFLRGYEMPDGSRTGLMFLGSMYNQYTELKDAGVDDRGTWAAMVYGHLPAVASGTSAAYALAKGRDFHSGDVLSAGQQALQVGAFGLEFVLSGGIGASRNTWRANAPNIREVADSVKAGARQLRADTAAFARGFDEASGRAMAGQFNMGADPTTLFKGLKGGAQSVRDARAAARRVSIPGDADFIGSVDFIGPRLAPERIPTNTLQFQGLEVRAVRDLSHMKDSTLRVMAEEGFAATTINGEKLVLHHHRQNPAGFIVEIPTPNHRATVVTSPKNNPRQHPFGTAKGAGLTDEQRAAFDDWRVEYWKMRAQQELARRATGGTP